MVLNVVCPSLCWCGHQLLNECIPLPGVIHTVMWMKRNLLSVYKYLWKLINLPLLVWFLPVTSCLGVGHLPRWLRQQIWSLAGGGNLILCMCKRKEFPPFVKNVLCTVPCSMRVIVRRGESLDCVGEYLEALITNYHWNKVDVLTIGTYFVWICIWKTCWHFLNVFIFLVSTCASKPLHTM